MEHLIELGKKLWDAAEPGFFEIETEKILKKEFMESGFTIEKFGPFTGFAATLDGDFRSKPIALISDMDALPLPGSGDSSYIHSCGHHVQMTALAGTALKLRETNPSILDRISFMAIPAEEYIDFGKRIKLKEEGKISRLSGKLELIERGVFNYPEVVISMHSATFNKPMYISSVLAMSGFKVMSFTFRGKAAHGGAAPHLGINAQNAASLFLQACAFLRESFDENKHIRIHPVLRLAKNQSVNLIPDYAFVETYVRGADNEAVETTVARLKNAAEGSAKALGAKVKIKIEKGYAPFKADTRLHNLLKETAASKGIPFIEEAFSPASSDVGDISRIKPTIMLGLPGSNGKFHNPAFKIINEEAAYVFPAEFLAAYLKKIYSVFFPFSEGNTS